MKHIENSQMEKSPFSKKDKPTIYRHIKNILHNMLYNGNGQVKKKSNKNVAINYFEQHSVNLFSGERLLHYVRNDRELVLCGTKKKVVIARPQAAAISSLLRIY